MRPDLDELAPAHITLAKGAAGLATGSLALISDAGHMVTDAAASEIGSQA